MTQFSRRARWLNALFPQSVAPANPDPALRSDDVSLVQTYDGGGWGIVEPSFPAEWDVDAENQSFLLDAPFVGIMDFLGRTGIATRSQLIRTDNNHYARVFAATRHGIFGGPGPDLISLRIHVPDGSGLSDHNVLVTPTENPTGTFTQVMPIGYGSINALGVSEGTFWCTNGPCVVPPGHELQFHATGGVAATQFRLSLQLLVLPVGASVQL